MTFGHFYFIAILPINIITRNINSAYALMDELLTLFKVVKHHELQKFSSKNQNCRCIFSNWFSDDSVCYFLVTRIVKRRRYGSKFYGLYGTKFTFG